jgi:hypothetical protein
MLGLVKRVLPVLAGVAAIVGFANFVWFFIESVNLGGDALNGFVRDGRYFVVSHGAATEVSRATWEWSRFHATSIFVTHPLAILGAAYLAFTRVFPSMMAGRSSTESQTSRAAWIRGTGPILAFARCAGQVGGVRYSGPLLMVSVAAAGIIVKPVFMAERSILTSEIRSIAARRGLFGWRVEVAHEGIDSASPLVLYIHPDHPVAQAIRDLGGRPVPLADSAGRPAPPVHLFAASSDRFMTLSALGGMVVAGGMTAVGVFWAIPQLGLFGVLWTAMAVFIGASHARRLMR